MLNLSKPYCFSTSEKQYLDKLLKAKNKKGELLTGPDMWNKSSKLLKNIKHRISVYTLAKQCCCCAYCESLILENPQIEHFAPKSLHREYTFESENLLTSCNFCNATSSKGSKDTIIIKSSSYRDSFFKIVHPYLDDPNDHIVFQNNKRITFDKARCSALGLNTIDFFDWDSIANRTKRLKEHSFRKMGPTCFSKRYIAELIREISTYK